MAEQQIEYEVEELPKGTWRRFRYEDGRRFEEYTSRRRFFGMPLLHYTHGLCPDTGKHIVAHGVLAIGKSARGVLAIGQFSRGLLAIGQCAIGVVAVGQLAVGLLLGL